MAWQTGRVVRQTHIANLGSRHQAMREAGDASQRAFERLLQSPDLRTYFREAKESPPGHS
jgi:hypothetical protein